MARIGWRWADYFSKKRFVAEVYRIAKWTASKNARERYLYVRRSKRMDDLPTLFVPNIALGNEDASKISLFALHRRMIASPKPPPMYPKA
jgi:hypothetical protein